MTIQEQILVDVNKNLTGINQSLYQLASDINKLIKKVYEEDKKVEKEVTSEEFEKAMKAQGRLVSKVYYRITFKGMGLYILNSFKFKLFPKFFCMNSKYFTECGFNWLGWIFEFQWNR